QPSRVELEEPTEEGKVPTGVRRQTGDGGGYAQIRGFFFLPVGHRDEHRRAPALQRPRRLRFALERRRAQYGCRVETELSYGRLHELLGMLEIGLRGGHG